MDTNIIEAIKALKDERELCRVRITAIDDQLKEIAGALPRRKRGKGEQPAKAKTVRKAKGSAAPPAEA